MISVRFISDLKIWRNSDLFIITIPKVFNKIELVKCFTNQLGTSNAMMDWDFLRKSLISDTWIKKPKIIINHEWLSDLEPSWDLAEYLSIIYDFMMWCKSSEVEKEISIVFNIKEKEIINMLFPSSSVEKFQMHLNQDNNNSEIQDLDRDKLYRVLIENGIRECSFSLYDDLKEDSIILYHNYHRWEIFYLDERGVRHMLNVCKSEIEACNYIYSYFLKHKGH